MLTIKKASELRPGDVFVWHGRLCRLRWRQQPDREWGRLAGYYTRLRWTDQESGQHRQFSFGNGQRFQVVAR